VSELVTKWRGATKDILVTLRDTVGPISVGTAISGQNSWDQPAVDPTNVRTLSLKEMAASCRFDIQVLGSYDEEMDTFTDA
jgi:hypothetical protein